MSTIKKILIIMLVSIVLFGCRARKNDKVSLAMTCEMITNNESITQMQDYYGSKDVVDRVVQTTVYLADDETELKALVENRNDIKKKYENLDGVTYKLDTKDLEITEIVEVSISKADESTLIQFEMIKEGETANISISKTKEMLEANKLAACKIIDSND